MKKLIALVCAAIMALTLFSMPAMADGLLPSTTDFNFYDFEEIKDYTTWSQYRGYIGNKTPHYGSLREWDNGASAGVTVSTVTGYPNSGSAMKITHDKTTTKTNWLITAEQTHIDLEKHDVYTSMKLMIINDDVVDATTQESAGKAQYAFKAENKAVFYIAEGQFRGDPRSNYNAVNYEKNKWYEILLKSDGVNVTAYVKDEAGKLVYTRTDTRGNPGTWDRLRFQCMTVVTSGYTGDEFAIDDLKLWAVPKGGDAATSPNYNVFATATASGVNITAHFDAVAAAKAAPKAIVAVFSADNTQLEDVKVVDLKTGVNDAVTFSKDLTGKNIRVVAVDSLGKLLPVLGDKIEVAITQAAQ